MYEYLKEAQPRLYVRYLTLERNMRAASNSFYDAFLDFQEEFLRTVAAELDIGISPRESCGAILRRADMESALKKEYGIADATYSKMQDYTLKVNAHKHRGEKAVQASVAVSYMRVVHAVLAAYAARRGESCGPLDEEYLYAIFGEYERENASLQREAEELRAELEEAARGRRERGEAPGATETGANPAPGAEGLSPEERNRALQREVSRLKDIKLASLEEKLQRTIDLLLELRPAVEENRAIVKAVGRRVGTLISGDGDVDAWVEAERTKDKES